MIETASRIVKYGSEEEKHMALDLILELKEGAEIQKGSSLLFPSFKDNPSEAKLWRRQLLVKYNWEL